MAKKAQASVPRAGIAFDPTLPNTEFIWRRIWCANFDWVPSKDEVGNPILNPDGTPQMEKAYHHFTKPVCECPPGPHVLAITTNADEIALGGGRGSAKSEDLLAFFAKGDGSTGDAKKPWTFTYLNHPGYRFLCLRKNAKDLAEFFSRAKTFFAPLGGTASENTIRFPSGAEGVFDHLADADSYEKYQGQQFTRIGIEELGQIVREDLYEKVVLGSLRTKFVELKTQVMVTFNPGGKGSGWINRRFIKLKTAKGNPVPWGVKFTSQKTRKSRIFIFSTVDDNPYFLRDESYVLGLESISDPILRRQWRFGDFDTLVGQFFKDFRERPLDQEPDEACHIVHESFAVAEKQAYRGTQQDWARRSELKPWWFRWIALDWGYQHASVVHWGCQNPNSQMHVYREMIRANVTPEELGESLALATMRDLEGIESRRMTLFVPPEFIDRKDNYGHTNGVMLQRGIERILGPGAVVIMNHAVTEESRDAVSEWDARLRFQQSAGIIIRPAFNKRVEGWQYMRGLMRWERLPSEKPFDIDFGYASDLMRDGKFELYNDYMAQANKQKPVVLPRLLIHDCCKLLIEAIPTAVFCDSMSQTPEDLVKTATNYDDALDAARYLIASHGYLQNDEPYEEYRQNRVDSVLERHPWVADSPNALVAVNRKVEEDYENRRGDRDAVFLARPWSRQWRALEDEPEPHPLHLLN